MEANNENTGMSRRKQELLENGFHWETVTREESEVMRPDYCRLLYGKKDGYYGNDELIFFFDGKYRDEYMNNFFDQKPDGWVNGFQMKLNFDELVKFRNEVNKNEELAGGNFLFSGYGFKDHHKLSLSHLLCLYDNGFWMVKEGNVNYYVLHVRPEHHTLYVSGDGKPKRVTVREGWAYHDRFLKEVNEVTGYVKYSGKTTSLKELMAFLNKLKAEK